jgi:hypothetical protein
MTVIFFPLILIAVLFIAMVALTGHHFAVLIAHIFHPHIFAVAVALVIVALVGFAMVRPSVHVANNPAEQINPPPAVQQWIGNGASASALEPGPYWWKLLLVVLLGGLVLAVVLAVFIALLKKGPQQFLGRIGGGGIALVIIGGIMLYIFAARSQVSRSYSVTPPPLPPGYIDAKTIIDQALAQGSTRPAYQPTVPISMPSASDNLKAENDETTPTTSTDKPPANDSRPAWIKAGSHRDGDSFLMVVQTGPYADPLFREQMLDATMVVETNRFIDDMLYHRSGVGNTVNIEPEYLRANCLRKQYPKGDAGADEKQLFAQLEFNNEFKSEVDRRYRQFLSLDRVQILGGLGVTGFALLGGIYIFLRLMPKKPSVA